jgi:ferric-chelate reductase
VVRWKKAFLGNGIGHTATVEELEPGMLRVTIPTSLKWRPGQHYFFRFFVGAHAMSSHPFTVASIPSAQDSEIELFIKVGGGITGRLAAASSGKALTSKVWLDGPYGGVEGRMECYEHVLLAAGGSGAFALRVSQG